jgi:O-acetyl-ADP-ribose deacetylase (regulator of RNase III)
MTSCFVIMPFGQKKDPGGKDINFDTVYTHLIKEGVEQIKGLSCTRCDEIEEPGVVHKKMLEQIYQADVAVVDITTLNPNVFYELGVRHALADHVTVIIKRKGTQIPFNIRPLNAIEYDTDMGSVAEAKKKIVTFIQNGLKTRKVDSLVHDSLPIRIAEESVPLQGTRKYKASLGATGKKIGIITGDVTGVEGVDVWVSSENTNMQMARFYERSISGTIRYHGGKRNPAGQVTDDILQKELTGIAGDGVPAAAVIATSAGELADSNRVKRIFHAAAVHGHIGRGFMPIQNIDDCITNALKLADSAKERKFKLRSILFPLLGTGQGGGKVRETVKSLVAAAKSYLEGKTGSVIEEVYFLCRTEKDLEECQWAFDQAGLVLADA